jgi:hypothetical protein
MANATTAALRWQQPAQTAATRRCGNHLELKHENIDTRLEHLAQLA